MKKTIITRIAVICCISAMVAAMAACGSNQSEPSQTPQGSATQGSSADASADTSEYADYIGYQFAGTDPWGGEVAITIRTIKDGTMELTYTDVPSKDITVYAECTQIPVAGDGTAPIAAVGKLTDQENVSFNYVGSLEFKDGQIILTYEEGSITTTSDQGDSDSYQVGPLTDEEKTVVLTKTVDPS